MTSSCREGSVKIVQAQTIVYGLSNWWFCKSCTCALSNSLQLNSQKINLLNLIPKQTTKESTPLFLFKFAMLYTRICHVRKLTAIVTTATTCPAQFIYIMLLGSR